MNNYDRMKKSGISPALSIFAVLFLGFLPLDLAAQESLQSSPTLTASESAPKQEQAQEHVVTSPTVTSTESAKQDRSGGGLITPGETLTLERCIDIALKKNPGIIAAANTVGVNKSRVGEARSAYYPQLSASAGYTKSSTTSSVTGSSGSFDGSVRSDQYSAAVTLNQNILDFGKTSSSVNIAKHNFESSQQDFVASENNTVQTVKQAYYGVLQTKRNRDVAADVIKQFQLHLDQAKGFYEVGTKAKIDVIKAEVDLSNAKLSLINAENAHKIAWVNLNNAIGVPDAPEYGIEDNLSFQPYVITLEEATARAFENRPDLKSIIARRQAAESNISFARSGYYPVLSGSASYSRTGTDLSPSELNDSWQAGVFLTVPLFSGFLTSHQVAEAKSNLYVLKANEESLRQQILLEVRQAYLNLQAADASISTSDLAAQQAKENLDLANGRYAAGVGSPVEVSDAFATYVTAQANHTTALANYKIAQANIEKAMGLR